MDAVLVIGMFIVILVPFILAKLWWWVALWATVALVLGIFEIVSYLVTGKTISQQFWKWSKDPSTPLWKRWSCFGGMIIFWLFLLAHLFL